MTADLHVHSDRREFEVPERRRPNPLEPSHEIVVTVRAAMFPHGNLFTMILVVASVTIGHVQAFGGVVSSIQNSVGTQCLEQFQELDQNCGKAAPGKTTPATCSNALCQTSVLDWWPKCKTQSIFHLLDENHHGECTEFYGVCKQASKPTCGACSGHASAKDTLQTDNQVLVVGEARTNFTRIFVGEMANLLCVPSGQVHVTGIDATTKYLHRYNESRLLLLIYSDLSLSL